MAQVILITVFVMGRSKIDVNDGSLITWRIAKWSGSPQGSFGLVGLEMTNDGSVLHSFSPICFDLVFSICVGHRTTNVAVNGWLSES